MFQKLILKIRSCMATQTITIAQLSIPSVHHIPLTPKTITCGDLRYYLDRLDDIIGKFHTQRKNWTDTLSKRLFDWSKRAILEIDPQDLPDTVKVPTEVLKDAVALIEILRREILVNPLSQGDALKSPVLERNWVWEEWMYHNYVTVQNGIDRLTSPFDDQPMEPIRVHQFAVEMLQWMNSVIHLAPAASAVIPAERSVVLLERSIVLSQGRELVNRATWEAPANERHISRMYKICVLKSNLWENERLKNKEIQKEALEYVQLWDYREQLLEDMQVRLKKKEEERASSLAANLDQQAEAHAAGAQNAKTTENILRDQLKAEQEKLKAAEAELARKAEEMAQYQRLAAENSAAAREYTNARVAGCRAETAVFQQSINNTVDELKKTQEAQLSGVQANLEATKKKVQAAKVDHEAIDKTCTELRNRVKKMDIDVASYKEQVTNLSKKKHGIRINL
jgi:hypothetical protein